MHLLFLAALLHDLRRAQCGYTPMAFWDELEVDSADSDDDDEEQQQHESFHTATSLSYEQAPVMSTLQGTTSCQ